MAALCILTTSPKTNQIGVTIPAGGTKEFYFETDMSAEMISASEAERILLAKLSAANRWSESYFIEPLDLESAITIQDMEVYRFDVRFQNTERLLASYVITADGNTVYQYDSANDEYIELKPEEVTNPKPQEGLAINDADVSEEQSDFTSWAQKSMDEIIEETIMEHHEPLHHVSDGYDYACGDFVTLDTESMLVEGREVKTDAVTYYGWVLYELYKVKEDGIENVGGSHIPTVLTYEVTQEGYKLVEYWEPRDGSYFALDIREKFPDDIEDAALDSQRFIYPQTMNCYAQIIEKSHMGTFAVIGRHMDNLTLAYQDNPESAACLNSDNLDYRELIHFGEFTLAYRDKFENERMNPVWSQILDYACKEIESIIESGYYKRIDSTYGELIYSE